MDKAAVDCSEENANVSTPLETKHKFFLLVETMGSNEEHDRQKFENFLDVGMTKNFVENGVLASDVTQSQNIWRLRESFTEALLADGYVYKCDISLPLKHFYEMVEETRQVSDGLAKRVIAYGHLGDGNLHLNITSAGRSSELEQRLFPFIYKWTSDRGGSISAEHGIGLAKRNYLHYAKRPDVIQKFRELKNLFDPKQILNPYKCIPDE